MSLSISIPKTGEQIPLDSLLAFTRTAIGLGIGMLVADRIRRPFRQATAITLVRKGQHHLPDPAQALKYDPSPIVHAEALLQAIAS